MFCLHFSLQYQGFAGFLKEKRPNLVERRKNKRNISAANSWKIAHKRKKSEPFGSDFVVDDTRLEFKI